MILGERKKKKMEIYSMILLETNKKKIEKFLNDFRLQKNA